MEETAKQVSKNILRTVDSPMPKRSSIYLLLLLDPNLYKNTASRSRLSIASLNVVLE